MGVDQSTKDPVEGHRQVAANDGISFAVFTVGTDPRASSGAIAEIPQWFGNTSPWELEAAEALIGFRGAAEIERAAAEPDEMANSRPHHQLVRPQVPKRRVGGSKLVDGVALWAEENRARHDGVRVAGKHDVSEAMREKVSFQGFEEPLRLRRQPVAAASPAVERVERIDTCGAGLKRDVKAAAVSLAEGLSHRGVETALHLHESGPQIKRVRFIALKWLRIHGRHRVAANFQMPPSLARCEVPQSRMNRSRLGIVDP